MSSKPRDFGAERKRLRRVVATARPLVEELRRMYPARVPDLNASDREIGAHIGQQKMLELLELLLAEADADAGGAFRTTEKAQILPVSL